jgi:hypothetical protein
MCTSFASSFPSLPPRSLHALPSHNLQLEQLEHLNKARGDEARQRGNEASQQGKTTRQRAASRIISLISDGENDSSNIGISNTDSKSSCRYKDSSLETTKAPKPHRYHPSKHPCNQKASIHHRMNRISINMANHDSVITANLYDCDADNDMQEMEDVPLDDNCNDKKTTTTMWTGVSTAKISAKTTTKKMRSYDKQLAEMKARVSDKYKASCPEMYEMLNGPKQTVYTLTKWEEYEAARASNNGCRMCNALGLLMIPGILGTSPRLRSLRVSANKPRVKIMWMY